MPIIVEHVKDNSMDMPYFCSTMIGTSYLHWNNTDYDAGNKAAQRIANSICTHALTSIHGKVFGEDTFMAGVTSNLEQ